MGRPTQPKKRKLAATPDSSTSLTEFEPARKVFDIDHLRETILDYVIHNGKSVSIANAKSCRLVNKTWYRTTSRVLLTNRESLFHLDTKIREYEPIKGTIYQFMESLPKMLLMDEQIPPHSIQCSVNLFHRQNQAFFQECFRTCGSSLISLELQATPCRNAMPLNTNTLFPKLQMFRMYLDNSIDFYLAGQMDNKINYIQSVFNSSEQLKSFVFSWHFRPVPDNFNNLIFPTTLTELVLDCYLNHFNLEALVKSPLSNLKKLELYIFQIPFRNEILTKILENVRKTLESFSVRGQEMGPITLQLPLMEKMKELKILSEYPQLENDSLERFVPQLNDLILEDQSMSAFRRYTDTSCFLSVTSLKISLQSQILNDCNFDLNDMRSLKTAFPNLQKLCISIFDLDTTAYVFIMKRMRNLKHLHLEFKASSWEGQVAQVADSAFWDALFIGVTAESVAVLMESPGLWKNVKKQIRVSIHNLAELHTLEITFTMPNKLFEISNAAFRFAFFKMPNLSNLAFLGDVSIPKKMIKKWRKRGHRIDTICKNEDSCSEFERI